VVVLLTGILGACGSGSTPTTPVTPAAISFNCVAGPSCPVLTISGDPLYVLPNGLPSPYRGFADPSLRKDPNSPRLWLSYSYVGLHTDIVGNATTPVITPYVSIHLAHSDDKGANWQYDRPIWESQLGTDQGATLDTGYSIHEVSTLTPVVQNTVTAWFGLQLRYFLKQGDTIDKRKGDSFLHRLTRGTTPMDLGMNAEARLTNSLTAAGWGSDLRLSSLSADLATCTLFSEPALFQDSGKLYFLTECLSLDLTMNPPTRRYNNEFNAVFATDVGSDVTKFNWQYLGKITDSSVAAEFGHKLLTQVDIARARDGKLLLLVTPSDGEEGGTIAHQGCRVLEIASLNPPRLARHADGSLVVRADIRSSDSQSSGLCTYDPAADTGVILVRTRIDLTTPVVAWQLHATGIQP